MVDYKEILRLNNQHYSSRQIAASVGHSHHTVKNVLNLYKRLDNGCFQWPRSEMEAKLLTPQQVRWLLEGLKIEQPKVIREGKPGALY